MRRLLPVGRLADRIVGLIEGIRHGLTVLRSPTLLAGTIIWSLVLWLTNALAFYIVAYRRTTSPGAAADAPRSAQIIAAISLCMWIGVIVAGRLLTFYRPGDCGVEGPGAIAECIPR